MLTGSSFTTPDASTRSCSRSHTLPIWRMLGTPKRSRGEDDDYDEADSQRARYADEGDCSEDAGNDSYQPNGSQPLSENFMSQMDNPTPAAQRGLYLGQKQIQDRVHGQITLDRLLLLVMDTPDFQRLDNIK